MPDKYGTTPQVQIEVFGLEEIRARANKAGTRVRISLNEGLRRIGRAYLPHLRAATPVRTGRLRRSSLFQIVGGPNDQALEVRQGARSPQGVFYGRFVREGTRFSRPNPYHIRALQSIHRRIQTIVNYMGERVAAYIAGREP